MPRLCVFCGSRIGKRQAYVDSARELGTLLASRGIGLVFGGGHIGLMGVLADAVLEAGGEAVGVIPESLRDRELAHTGLTQLHVVPSMHDRKALMADLSDGFIALPGGYGTADELFEILTWAQLGIHNKPIGLLNVEGYFDGLLAWLQHAVAEDLVKVKHLNLLVSASMVRELLERILELIRG
jgi:uncharacterized protein (TIGR00730 family)